MKFIKVLIFIFITLSIVAGLFLCYQKNQDYVTEKNMVIEGMIRTLDVSKSKDPDKIREYTIESLLDGVDMDIFRTSPDSDMFDRANLYISKTQWTEEDLRSPGTKFIFDDEPVYYSYRVRVILKNGDEYTARKVRGVWY